MIRRAILAGLLALCAGCASIKPVEQNAFHETLREYRPADDVRALHLAPAEANPRLPTRLLIYLTPNGNTIEQTLGAKLLPGLDWHYDIQHVGAQVRLLRQVETGENLHLVLLEPDSRSWPAWRAAHADNAARIAALLEQLRLSLPADTRITLAAHSGGGSFIFGLLNHGPLPAAVERIVFLDANYSFDAAAGHGARLLDWLRGDARRQLFVLAYDDRNIAIDGKLVNGPEGGTWRASGRMRDYFASRLPLQESHLGDFDVVTALPSPAPVPHAQIAFYLHRNPANAILHTRLVGEMNGLAMAAAYGTTRQDSWGTFGGPRAYEAFVQAAPAIPAGTLLDKIPPRAADAIGGAAFMQKIANLDGAEREAAIRAELMAGNMPAFLHRLRPVSAYVRDAAGANHLVRYFVMPDYLAVGSDSDFVRMPMTPMTAQALADAFNSLLPTAKMADAIWQQADLRLAPQPLTEAREAAATFWQHHALIEAQRQPPVNGLLIAGIKKDIVITNRLEEKPQRVAIYGWHQPDGKAIQPVSIVHKESYVDYSHGVRLVSVKAELDGKAVDLRDLLRDPVQAAAVSAEGALTRLAY